MTGEQIAKIRLNVMKERNRLEEEAIQNHISWSTQASSRWWITRFLFNLPNKTKTRQQAIEYLTTPKGTGYYDSYTPMDYAQNYGSKVLELCTAINTSKTLGVEMCLNLDQVLLLKSWYY